MEIGRDNIPGSCPQKNPSALGLVQILKLRAAQTG